MMAIGGFAALCTALVVFAPSSKQDEGQQAAQVEAVAEPSPAVAAAPMAQEAPAAQMAAVAAQPAGQNRAPASVIMPADLDESQRQEMQAQIDEIAMVEQQMAESQMNEVLDESSFGIVDEAADQNFEQ